MLELLPPKEDMYKALVERDAAFEGLFFAGVTTTGIFCRPTCPARKPKSENVEYFGSPGAAIEAGFRPCLRCRPMEMRSRIESDDAPAASDRESTEVFRAAFDREFGSASTEDPAAAPFCSTWMDSPLGEMLAVTSDPGLHLLEFVDRRVLKKEVARLQKATGAAIIPGETGPSLSIRAELEAYFSGACLQFRTPLVPHGTPFQELVWDALVEIPAGETRSYGEIAAAIGKPTATRAVAQANGANQLAIIIPCHRVIGSDGSLTGYGGGRWRKRWLLDHEQRFKAS